MDIPAFHRLISDEGQQLFIRPRDSDLDEANTLRYITELRKSHSQDLVNAAIATTLL